MEIPKTMDTMNGSQEQRPPLVVTISLLALFVFFAWIINLGLWYRYRISPFYSQTIFNIICLISFLSVPHCNPFIWSKTLIKEKASRPRYKLRKGIAIGLALLIISVKTAGAHYFNYCVEDSQPHVMGNIPLDTLVFLLGAFSEEVLLKAGLLRVFLERKIPRILAMAFVSIVFMLMHFNFSPLHLVIYFFYQMYSLTIFSLYPSMVFVSFFHFAWNMSMFA